MQRNKKFILIYTFLILFLMIVFTSFSYANNYFLNEINSQVNLLSLNQSLTQFVLKDHSKSQNNIFSKQTFTKLNQTKLKNEKTQYKQDITNSFKGLHLNQYYLFNQFQNLFTFVENFNVYQRQFLKNLKVPKNFHLKLNSHNGGALQLIYSIPVELNLKNLE